MSDCPICASENVVLLTPSCCSYAVCEGCVKTLTKKGKYKCPQCRTNVKAREVTVAPAPAPAPAPAAPSKASVFEGDDDDLQVALAASALSHEEEKKNFETSEAEWAQNLEAALAASLQETSRCDDEEAKEMEEALKASLAAEREAASRGAAEDAELSKALKASKAERSREDMELRAALRASLSKSGTKRPLEKSSIPEGKRARKSPSEFSGYKLIRSSTPSKDGVSMMVKTPDGELPVDVSFLAAIQLSLKSPHLLRQEREREEAGDVCCGGDPRKACSSSCPFMK